MRTEDLYNEPERSHYSKYPNMKNCLASIGLPRGVYWKRMLLGGYKELFILSPESSPENSPENSQHTTPSSTFPREAPVGAAEERKGQEDSKR